MTNSHQHKVYEFENFRLDAATKLLYRGGEQVVLTPKAVETLIALVESQGIVISKEELMQKIWADTIVEESNLAQYLHVLRKTLGETSGGKSYIETLKRRGYRFNGAVRVVKNGNDLSTPTEDTENLDQWPNEQPKGANLISRRVERRGNVRAFSHVAADRETGHPVNVERSDNIYSVSDWRREPVADTSLRVVQPTRSKWFSPLVAVVLVAGFAGIVFGIYKFAMRGPSAETRSVPFRESEMTRLTTTGTSKRAAISPDGLYVAHIIASADGDSLWIRQVAVANETRIAPPSQREFVWVTFAPDGNFVYYLALERDKGEPELFRVPVLGGPIVKVANDIAPPTFSPDGTRMAFMKTNQGQSQLIVANADGTNEVLLVSRNEPDYLNMFWHAPAWSLDGKSIAFPVNQ
ncbi:MAG: LpqB family beta-propeller domain-containing protein, partial [Acidobacteriota bacterium]